MTIVRKEKKPGKDEPVVEKEVTFEESIHFEEFPVLNESEEILVLVDEAHRSHTRGAAPQPAQGAAQRGDHRLHGHADPQQREDRDPRNLRRIHRQVHPPGRGTGRRDRADSVRGSHRGRHREGRAWPRRAFRGHVPRLHADELALIKAKYATEGDVLEAPMLIEQKARDMLRHYVGVVFPRVSRRKSSRRAAQRR